MQFLFNSVSRSKQSQFGEIPLCVTVTLEEVCALHYLQDVNKKANKCRVLIALNVVFPYSLSGMWEAKGLWGKEEFIVKF